MKKIMMGAVLLAVCGSAFASELPPTDYTCIRETETGFNVIGIKYAQYEGQYPFILFGESDTSLAYYRYDSLNDLKEGVYDLQRKSVISISSDNSNYPLKVHYKDEKKILEYSCQLDAEQTESDLEDWHRMHPTKKELAERKKAEAVKKAEAAALAALKKMEAERAAEQAGQRRPESVSSSASGADINNYVNTIRATIQRRLDASKYAGQRCSLTLHLSRDGTVQAVDHLTGDDNLCNDALAAIYEIDKFPSPPSDGVYAVFKDATLSLRL